jgi:hypothetical protein
MAQGQSPSPGRGAVLRPMRLPPQTRRPTPHTLGNRDRPHRPSRPRRRSPRTAQPACHAPPLQLTTPQPLIRRRRTTTTTRQTRRLRPPTIQRLVRAMTDTTKGGGGSDREITSPRTQPCAPNLPPAFFRPGTSEPAERNGRRARPSRVAYSCGLCGAGGIRSSWGRPRKYCGNCVPLALAAARAAWKRRARAARQAEKGGENVPNTLRRNVSQDW